MAMAMAMATAVVAGVGAAVGGAVVLASVSAPNDTLRAARGTRGSNDSIHGALTHSPMDSALNVRHRLRPSSLGHATESARTAPPGRSNRMAAPQDAHHVQSREQSTNEDQHEQCNGHRRARRFVLGGLVAYLFLPRLPNAPK